MTDDLVERVAMQLCRAGGYGLCVGQCHSQRCADAIEQYGRTARAIIPLVQAAERERCARVAEEYDCNACGQWFHPSEGHYDEDCPKGRASWGGQRGDSDAIAAAIRAGGRL